MLKCKERKANATLFQASHIQKLCKHILNLYRQRATADGASKVACHYTVSMKLEVLLAAPQHRHLNSHLSYDKG
jgi:hypothetical protein